jgi:hypothetical protein
MLMSDPLTSDNNLLNLSNSYYKTVFIDSSYLIGCFLEASSKSKFGGNLSNILLQISYNISSGPLPLPAVFLGISDKAVVNS